jgi:hypothetical protein
MPERRPPKTQWSKRPRSEQKRAYIRLKNKLAEHSERLGGLFTTHDVVDGSSWADIYFVSRLHRHRIYNGTVDTALYAYFAECENQAWKRGEQLLGYEDFSIGEIFAPRADGSFELAPDKPSVLEAERRAFGGLTRYEWIDVETDRLADSGDVYVLEGARLDFSYRYGVGLMGIVGSETLSVANIDAFVEEFLARGEATVDFYAVRQSFASKRRKEASSINAISSDPAEWAPPAPELAGARAAAIEAAAERSEISNGIRGVPVAHQHRSL